MKINLLTILFLLQLTAGMTQDFQFNYTGRRTPAVRQETLYKAKLLHEIMPQFVNHFLLPYNDKTRFSQNVRIEDGYYVRPKEYYTTLMDFVYIEITAISNGKTLSAHHTGDSLTKAQKQILNNIDPGTILKVKIRFKYKTAGGIQKDTDQKITEGTYAVTVVPETEAEFTGGVVKFSDYINTNFVNKVSDKNTIWKLRQIGVKFTVESDGRITGTKIFRSSNDPAFDKLLLDVIAAMPKWKPARNLLGIPVKQEFTLPLAEGC